MNSAEGVKPTTLILAVIAAIVATVGVLEYYGLLRHNVDKGTVPVGEFQAIFLEPGENFRLSPKKPELHAQCQDNYVVIASNTDPLMRGVLVDYKNRGIRCGPELSGQISDQNREHEARSEK